MKYRTLAFILWPVLPSCTADDANFVLDTVAFGAAVALNQGDLDARKDSYVAQGYSEQTAYSMASMDQKIDRGNEEIKRLDEHNRRLEIKRLQGSGAIRSCVKYDYEQNLLVTDCEYTVNVAYCVMSYEDRTCDAPYTLTMDYGDTNGIEPNLKDGEAVRVYACTEDYYPHPQKDEYGTLVTNCIYKD